MQKAAGHDARGLRVLGRRGARQPFRAGRRADLDPRPRGFDEFNEGNADPRLLRRSRVSSSSTRSVSLIDAFWRYMQEAADQSCGKCTPCRMGTLLVRDSLAAMREGKTRPARSRRRRADGPADGGDVAVRSRPELRPGADRGADPFPRHPRGGGGRGPRARPERHDLHDGALHRGLPVEDQRAALHRLHPRRQARTIRSA